MGVAALWPDRVLVAVASRTPEIPRAPGRRKEPAASAAVLQAQAADANSVLEDVALNFADVFDAGDREYSGARPWWHVQSLQALAQRADERTVRWSGTSWSLTASGRRQVPSAQRRLATTPGPLLATTVSAGSPQRLMLSGVFAAPLRQQASAAAGAADGASTKEVETHVMIELNLRNGKGPTAAFERLDGLLARLTGDQLHPYRLTEEYATASLTWSQLLRLVAADAVPVEWTNRAIYRVWPDFEVTPHVDASVVTVKADAAHRSFNCFGDDIVWAVIDSGIDETHPHFTGYATLSDPTVKDLHRTFSGSSEPTVEGALQDELGHGTHVAGIIAGGLDRWDGADTDVLVRQEKYNVADPEHPFYEPRRLRAAKSRLMGMAPRAKLVSLKVLGDGGTGQERVSRVIQALAYVREINAQSDKLPRIHGVNLSVGYEFDAQWFACGRSPLCEAVDKLVRTGVTVVVAAGNSGYGKIRPEYDAPASFSLGMTINDPGNAERAITVGSTHRDSPHGYGVSYFSSRGPTGDGRRKPDLVAPGERITSAAAGAFKAPVVIPEGKQDAPVYVEASGTSMAAPHVSGAIAAFLSVRREFIGRPDDVKRIFVSSAISLGRDPSFEGAGLLDLMRALQSV